jgi:DNA mismatch repair protein MutL
MSAARIQQLSASLVNRIAAGEVIERPAAVVKELVENALDAGATQIHVDVEDGGRELIRVIDNGNGIDPADLPLAFASHATSKLLTDDDLFAIHTMGFRGEALASIGSVSHSRILSRVPGVDAGYEIFNKGGVLSMPQAAAGNAGTVVEVRNLFFNTPARRKFIKGAPTEYGHISEMILRLSLPYPQVEFKLTHNGRNTLALPRCSAEDRLLSAWPDDFRDSRLAIDCQDAEIRLRGMIGLPELARPTAKYQFLYLNGRYIRDKFIQHALREAFRGLTEPGRYPAAVLMLEIPAQDVDVNVHPTKTEVRFRDGGRIHGLVLSGIREKLLGSDLTPAAVPMRVDRAADPRPDMREQLAAFFRQGPIQQDEHPTSNIEHPTSDIEHPTSNGQISEIAPSSSLQRSGLDVQRSTFATSQPSISTTAISSLNPMMG